jgi:hypothetical protein
MRYANQFWGWDAIAVLILSLIVLSLLTGCLSERKRLEIDTAARAIVTAAASLPRTPQTETILAAATIITNATATNPAKAP